MNKLSWLLLFLPILLICCSSDRYETSDLHIIKNYYTLSESVIDGGSLLSMSYVASYDKQSDSFFIEVRSIDNVENLIIDSPVYNNGSEQIRLEASVPQADDFNDEVFKIFINHNEFKSIVENGYYISFRVLTPVIGSNTYYINKTAKEKGDLLNLFNNI
ncbi:MAG: hypothetical protein KJO59_04570 [Ignavibacteria bacterium]|nr:hypothetical protein [Ignavibacteria bacterium]